MPSLSILSKPCRFNQSLTTQRRYLATKSFSYGWGFIWPWEDVNRSPIFTAASKKSAIFLSDMCSEYAQSLFSVKLYFVFVLKSKKLKLEQRRGRETSDKLVGVHCICICICIYVCICSQKQKKTETWTDRGRETSDELVGVLWHHLQFCSAHSVTGT